MPQVVKSFAEYDPDFDDARIYANQRAIIREQNRLNKLYPNRHNKGFQYPESYIEED